MKKSNVVLMSMVVAMLVWLVVNNVWFHASCPLSTSLHRTTAAAQSTNTNQQGEAASQRLRRNHGQSFPKIIHQTWKTKHLPSWAQNSVNTWKSKNPGYQHILYDDAEIDAFIKEHYPPIMQHYSLLKPVQKADVFRYLVLLVKGGFYADVDVLCTRPIDEWFQYLGSYSNTDFLAGFEEVTDRKDWAQWYATQFQIVQWSMASAPQHPILHHVMRKIVQYFDAGKHKNSSSIIKSTGPGIWSQAIKEYLIQEFNITMGLPPFTHKNMKMRGLHAGSVRILPKKTFASHYGSGDDVFIQHQFAGTWKKAGHRKFFDEGGKKAKSSRTTSASNSDSSSVYDQHQHQATVAGCDADKKKWCSQVKPGRGRTHKCLHAMFKAKKLSSACSKGEFEEDVPVQCNTDRTKICKETLAGNHRIRNCLTAPQNQGKISSGCAKAMS